MKRKSSSVKRKNLKNSIFNPQNKNKRIKKIYERFELLINQKQFKGYLVAVSGGADSLALAYLSKCYQIKNKNKNFHYVHVDHKLRDTSSKSPNPQPRNCNNMKWLPPNNFFFVSALHFYLYYLRIYRDPRRLFTYK